MSQPTYNLRNIRKLLTATFSDVELRRLCYDESQFRPVYEQFAAGTGKDQIVQQIIEYCERKGFLEILLEIVQDENPSQYAEFAGKLKREPAGERATPVTQSNPNVAHLQTLIDTNTRRLFKLQQKKALYGISTPPEIEIEIENLEAEIADLKQKLKS